MSLKERTAKGEKIGGGFIVLRRSRSSGRVTIAPTTTPFEHPTLSAAINEATRLAKIVPGKKFCVFGQMSECLEGGEVNATEETQDESSEEEVQEEILTQQAGAVPQCAALAGIEEWKCR